VHSERINIPIEFIFDEQEGVQADIDFSFDVMKRSLPRGVQKLISGRPIYKSDKLVLPLQAADMLAWHLRREHEDFGQRGQLPMADRLRSSSHLFSGIDDSHINNWARQFREMPGISRVQSKAQWQSFRREANRRVPQAK
jgi:hypothetical protein